MFEDVAEVRNHWWWRPGWQEGRHYYACHLTLDDQPRLRTLVARYQKATEALPMLDLVPPQWLHITTQGIGFIDEIRQGEADAIRQEIANRVGRLEAPTVTFQYPTIRPEAIFLKASPAKPIYAVRKQIHAAVTAVLGNDRVEPLPGPEEYAPHVSIAYVNSESSASPIAESVRSVKTEPVSAKFTKIDFLEFHRDNRMYEWTTATPIPFGIR